MRYATAGASFDLARLKAKVHQAMGMTSGARRVADGFEGDRRRSARRRSHQAAIKARPAPRLAVTGSGAPG